jgi:large subunit ribosomal protein L31
MKPEIHPNYVEATVHCACGHEFETLSTKQQIRVEICSNCHPFYTGKQKIVDTEGRVDKFMQRYGKVLKQQAKAAAAKK